MVILGVPHLHLVLFLLFEINWTFFYLFDSVILIDSMH